MKNAKNARSFYLFLFLFLHSIAFAEVPMLLGLGDSIGEGVQSVDANIRTQHFSYLNLIACKMGAEFPLPLISGNPFSVVGSTRLRSRLNPSIKTFNLAVSGADVDSILNERSDALNVDDIDSEIDLVLFPRIGSQIGIAESVGGSIIICWVGNNDALSSIVSFDELDGSQVTEITEFEDNFTEIAERLVRAGEKVVFANIGDVTNTGFLLNQHDLNRFLGNDFGLEKGSFTSAAVMLLVKHGLADETIFSDPNFILDADEIAMIQERIDAFNQIINRVATRVKMPVVDINKLLDDLSTNGRELMGVQISTCYLGGVFSLDGVHPSSITHAFLANAFIETINSHFNSTIPLISDKELERIFINDPHVDKDGDGLVKGRLGAGLLETIAPLFGISGDNNDFAPNQLPSINIDPGKQFIQWYLFLQGQEQEMASQWGQDDSIAAFKHIFGVRSFTD